MKFLNYFLTFIFGLIGVLALLRTIERLANGQGLMVVQLLVAAGGLVLAQRFLRKARGKKTVTETAGPQS